MACTWAGHQGLESLPARKLCENRGLACPMNLYTRCCGAAREVHAPAGSFHHRIFTRPVTVFWPCSRFKAAELRPVGQYSWGDESKLWIC